MIAAESCRNSSGNTCATSRRENTGYGWKSIGRWTRAVSIVYQKREKEHKRRTFVTSIGVEEPHRSSALCNSAELHYSNRPDSNLWLLSPHSVGLYASSQPRAWLLTAPTALHYDSSPLLVISSRYHHFLVCLFGGCCCAQHLYFLLF